jgi:uncharacterized protein with HEPN domain
MRADSERLRDILKGIDQIVTKAGAGPEVFARDEMLQVWVIHHLQVIGEAARCLSEEFRLRHPDGVWSKASGMRNILVHHYFEIDHALVWKVVEQDLPKLRRIVERILREEAPPSSPTMIPRPLGE